MLCWLLTAVCFGEARWLLAVACLQSGYCKWTDRGVINQIWFLRGSWLDQRPSWLRSVPFFLQRFQGIPQVATVSTGFVGCRQRRSGLVSGFGSPITVVERTSLLEKSQKTKFSPSAVHFGGTGLDFVKMGKVNEQQLGCPEIFRSFYRCALVCGG